MAGAGKVTEEQPIALLIAALGGEGGGVLTDWIVSAASIAGYPVQSTSIPGVAQRTGATTYYVELFPRPVADLGGRSPVMALYPGPGRVDLMVASELIEAGRALEGGFVTPDRTTLIASTHRVMTIAEKSAMADGAYDDEGLRKAARELAKRPLLFDFAGIARQQGVALNAVLLGAIAGSGELPAPADAFVEAIRMRGVAVEANLKGFEAGRACIAGELEVPAPGEAPPRTWSLNRRVAAGLLAHLSDSFPAECLPVLEEGVKRVADYQNVDYAVLYLERLGAVLEAERWVNGNNGGYLVTRETARRLAVWMTFEDVIRVAELKTRSLRFARIREEVGAKPGEPVQVTEFLKPGVDEIGSLLPPPVGRPLIALAERTGLKERLRVPMRVRSDSITGFFCMWGLAKLKRWRPRSHRFAEEQALIERWLAAVGAAARGKASLALEIAACADLVKGYGETHARGRGNFLRILETLIEPTVADGGGAAAEAIRAARNAALADPEGVALDEVLAKALQIGTIIHQSAAAAPIAEVTTR